VNTLSAPLTDPIVREREQQLLNSMLLSSPEGQTVESCSITYDLWLDPGFQKADEVCEMLKPFDPATMKQYEVSSRVNPVKNDDAACAEAVMRESAAGI
jgi:hypothetical protein